MIFSIIHQMVLLIVVASLLAAPSPSSASPSAKHHHHHHPRNNTSPSTKISTLRHQQPQQQQQQQQDGHPKYGHLTGDGDKRSASNRQKWFSRHRKWLILSDVERRERLRDLQAFKRSLLRILGLSSEPKPRGRVRIPAYMLELYDQVSRRNQVRRSSKVIKRDGKRANYDGNTIRSFEPTIAESVGFDAMRIFFNVSSDLDKEHLNGAELRLFRQSLPVGLVTRPKRRSVKTQRRQNDGRKKEEREVNQFKINVYQVLEPSSSAGGQLDSVTRLLDSKAVDSGHQGWESFDVSVAVRSWQAGSEVNHGLQVVVTTVDNRPISAVQHVRLRRSSDGEEEEGDNQRRGEETEEEPLLVTYGDDRAQDEAADSQQDRRHQQIQQQQQQQQQQQHRSSKIKKRASGRKKSTGKASFCRRRSLHIDFSELEWNDWIIAPPGYEAFMCNGTCPVILPDHLNATNHAQIQSLLHSVNRALAPAPCCVPTELSPISMLYVNELDKVVLKNYEDMIVDACGCR